MGVKTQIKRIAERFYQLPFIQKPLPQSPFGETLWAQKESYIKLYKEAISFNDDKVKAFERDIGFAINLDYWRELALHTQVVIKPERLNFFHGRILYSVLSKYLSERENLEQVRIFETGSARGFSSICMAKALIDRDYPGFIATIDVIPHDQRIFWNCIDDHEGPKTRTELLHKWPEELTRIIFLQGWTSSIISQIGLNRINFAFLDSQHTKKDVLREFNYVSRRQKIGDIIVFDDVTEGIFQGVCEAVQFISENYPYDVRKFQFSDSRGYAIAKRNGN